MKKGSFYFYTRGRAKIIGAAACALAAVGLALGAGGASATPISSSDGDAAAEGQSRVVIDSEVSLTPNKSNWNKEQQVDLKGATPGFVQLSAGYFHAAALSNGGVLYTWGLGDYGQLGNGSTAPKAVPAIVDATGVLKGVAIKKVSVGQYHTVALGEDGNVYTWGRNDQGQLGDGTRTNRKVPVEVDRGEIPDDVEIVDIAAAVAATIALGSDGRVYEWGNLMEKAPSADALLVPTLRTGLEGQFATEIVAGAYDAMVLTDRGALFGWGTNRSGRLGVGDAAKHLTPVQVDTSGVLSGKNIVGVSLSLSNYAFPTTFAWDSEGQIYSWGSNSAGQLGIGETGGNSYLPVSVDMSAFEGHRIIDVKAGVAHALALTDDDMIYAWGLNKNTNTSSSDKDGGQLGTGDQVNRLVPEQVDMSGELAGQAPFINIGVGAYASFALGNDGKVFSWGTSGRYFLLGDGREEQYAFTNVPAKGPWISNLTGVIFETVDGSTVITPDNIERDASDARARLVNDYTTLRFTAPAYGQKPAKPRCEPVGVVAEFELMGGDSSSGLTVQWPTAEYKYCADPELSWDGEPTAELEDDADFAEGNTVRFTFAGVASGEASLADTSFVVSEFIGTGSAPEMTCTPEEVGAGESFVCTGTYTLTADDVIRGQVSLTGKVSATYDDKGVDVIGGEKTAGLYREGSDSLVVTFDLNGGGGDFRALVASPGGSVHVYDHAPVRDGYEFAGWLPVTQMVRPISAMPALIKPGADHSPFGNTVMVAQWKEIEPPTGPTEPTEPPTKPTEPTEPDTELPLTAAPGGNNNSAGNGNTGSLAQTGTNVMPAVAVMALLASLGVALRFLRKNRLAD